MNWLIAWALGAALMTLAVLAIRALLKGKLSLRARYALWVILAVRLLTPVQLPFSLPVSLPALPDLSGVFSPAPVRGEMGIVSIEQADVFAPAVPGTANYDRAVIYTVPSDGPGSALVSVVPGKAGSISGEAALTALWALGAATVLGAVAVSNWRFSRKLRRVCRPLEVEGCPLPVYVAAFLPSPCLAGIFWPAVYLTPEAAEDETTLRHVLAHELTHYAHRDHLWGAVRCLCLALHWYNPLVWLAAALSKGDGELACDEGAVERLGEEERIPYGKTLVGLVARRTAPADLLSCSTAMTGSGKTVRQRIELLVRHPHTVRTALFAAVSVLALCLVCAFAGGEAAPAEDAPDMDELALQLVLLDPAYEGMDREELTEQLKPAVLLTQTDGSRTLLLVQYPGLAHADGLDDLAAGVWDGESKEFLPGRFTLRGDEAGYTAWTEADGGLYLLCANATEYQGYEAGTAPLWLRFREGELTQLTALPAIARTTSAGEGLPGDNTFFDSGSDYWLEHRIVPGEGGFTLYEQAAGFQAPPQEQWGEVGFVPLTVIMPGEENVAETGRETAPNGPYAWGHTQDFTPDPSQRGTWETDLRAVVTRQRGALLHDTLEITGQPGGIETFFIDSEHVTLALSGWNGGLTGYGETVGNLCQLPAPGDAGALSPWFRVIQDGRLVPGRGSFDLTNGVFAYAFDQPLALPYVGDQVAIEIGPAAGAWSVEQAFTPDPAGAASWNADFRATVYGYGDGDAYLHVRGSTGALTSLSVFPTGLYFTGYGYFETAQPGVSWEMDPTFAALNDLALRGINEDIQGEVSQWLYVTRNGQRVPGTFRGHAMEGEANFSYDFDAPLDLRDGDRLEVRVGPTTVSDGTRGRLPGVFPMDLEFSSGAGAWFTDIVLQADGAFTGEYRDDDMGDNTAYVCSFRGKFGDIQQVTAASWSMTLEELVLDTGRPIGEKWTESGTRYVSSSPYGFDRRDEATQENIPLEAGAKFMFYTPGAAGHAPGTELYGMEEFQSWWPGRHAFASAADRLGCYGLCAVETERGFFTN